jgi:ABC-type multidrug transport system fused ATPase/permease subunit
MTATKSTQGSEQKESLLLNLVLNIIIPTVILTKFSGDEHLGPRLSIVVALAFPIAYGIMDFVKQKKINFFSALGVVSVFLTGGISLLELPPKYIAIKEAAIPAALGLATLISTYTKYPLVRVFLYNDKVLATELISKRLADLNNTNAFDRTLIRSSYIVAASFFLSSALNYALAKVVVVSQPGTQAFAEELGKMTAYSYVVIVIPSIAVMIFAMYYLFRNITRLTGLKLEEVFLDTKGK